MSDKVSLNIEFEDKDSAIDCLKYYDYKFKLEEVWDQCFRPNFKHGYTKDIEDIVEKCGKENAYELVEKLAEIYREVVND